MTVDVRIRAISLAGGGRIELPRAGVICIVGSNNAGKSQLLRDVVGRLQDPDSRPITISGLELDASTFSIQEATEWLESHATKQEQPMGQQPSYLSPHGEVTLPAAHFHQFFQSSANSVWHAYPYIGFHVTAGGLLNLATGGIGIPGRAPNSSPMYKLFRDGSLERELSDLCNEVFEFPLTLDRINGDVRLRVGRPTAAAPRLDDITVEYADQVAALQSLEQQGDGVKSFLGMALGVIAGPFKILVVDEPESFLHPAQARALGRWSATQARERDRQVLVATHDRDFILGLLDSSAPVTLVRIARHPAGTQLHQLSPLEVSGIWDAPVMKYSNVLQGLFHKRVVICESDADCRFYGAVLDTLAMEVGHRGRADETLFVPSGGKQRVASMGAALAKLGVRADAIVDFDILRTRDDIRGIVEALGGAWSKDMDDRYVTLSRDVNQRQLWQSLKNLGLDGIPAGQAYVAAAALLDDLKACNVHVVRVGEIEDFNKSIGLHGAAWVSAMLELDGHKTCAAARDLLRTLVA